MNNSISIKLSCLALLSCACSPIHAAGACEDDPRPIAGVGSTNGGAANYELKIDLPDKEAKTAPSISLFYSSRSGNGIAGMGWSLWNEGSAIHRCPATVAQDGYSDNVRYVKSDRLCLDGKRLVLLEGEYGMDKSRYATEIYDGHSLILRGNIHDKDSSFIVYSPEKYASIYDWPVQPEGAPAPLSWLRTRFATNDGTTIDFGYTNVAAGETIMEMIRYPGHVDANRRMLGDHFVRFEYTNRNDVSSTWLGGGEARLTRLLSRISTGTHSPDGSIRLHSTYNLHYRESLASSRSLLMRVEGGYYDTDGSYRCFEPTSMDWIDEHPRFAASRKIGLPEEYSSPSAIWQINDKRNPTGLFPTGDIDVDGRRDLLFRSIDTNVELIKLDTKLQSMSRMQLPENSQLLPQAWSGQAPDFRNLGAAYLPSMMSRKIVGLGWTPTKLESIETGLAANGEILMMDFTSDGKVDVLRSENSPDGYRLSLHRGTRISPEQTSFSSEDVLVTLPGETNLMIGTEGWLSGNRPTILLRRDEKIIYLVDLVPRPSGHEEVRVRSPKAYGVDSQALQSRPLFVDVNGDATRDLVFSGTNGRWHTQINADGYFLPAHDTGLVDDRSATGRSGTLVADLNNDRFEEIVYPEKSLVEFCMTFPTDPPACGDDLARQNPQLDFGIYEYKTLVASEGADGKIHLKVANDYGIVGQANRTAFADIDGDGHADLIAPFDPGFKNGSFRVKNGSLSSCPVPFGCGAAIAQRAFVTHDDRRNGNLETISSIRQSSKRRHEWVYFPLSNPERVVYAVPDLASPHRHVDDAHFHFRSSMYVVGEHERKTSKRTYKSRYSYGAGVYNIQGRGFQGFKWITSHDPSTRQRQVHWFRQIFPYTGRSERFWIEPDRDGRIDHFSGTPGRNVLTQQTQAWHCNGPANHHATIRARCQAHDYPVFEVLSGDRKDLGD